MLCLVPLKKIEEGLEYSGGKKGRGANDLFPSGEEGTPFDRYLASRGRNLQEGKKGPKSDYQKEGTKI